MNEKKTPRIRFKGFTDDWEQRKVGELLSERIEQFPKSDEYPLMAFVANEGVAPKGDRYDRSALVNDTEGKLYKRTEFGDFIYSSNNLETGSIGLNKYGNATISPVYSIFRPTGIADSDFIGRRFVRKDFINEMVKWRQGVIYGQWKIHEEDFLKIEVMVPSLEEQRRIGSFLDNLDHLITLHQRKYEKLQIIKKSMLENCFPKNGEKVPKIRFSGFARDWEQRKLGDLYTERNERGNGSLQILSVSIHTGVSDGELDVDNLGKFVRRSEDKSTYKHVHSGDLIFNMMRAWQGAIGVAKTEGMISPAYISAIPSEDIYPPFMNYLLRRKDVINQINNLSYGVTDFRKRLYWNSFVQVNCKLPSVEEQRNITDVFEKIDHLITLHQRKRDDLKDLKRVFLYRISLKSPSRRRIWQDELL